MATQRLSSIVAGTSRFSGGARGRLSAVGRKRCRTANSASVRHRARGRGSGMILIQQLIPKLVGRIQTSLKGEILSRPWICTLKLYLGRVELIRQIVRAANIQRGISQFACPDANLLPCLLVRPLLVVDDERKYLRTRPRQE